MSEHGLRPCVIVHYHEISLKRGNRPLFLRRLQENLARAVGDLGPAPVHQLPGRIVLDLAGHPRPEAVRERLDRVCGIANTTLDNSAAYLQSWMQVLRHDPTLLVHAAAQAQKAADYIQNLHPDEGASGAPEERSAA